MRLYTPKRLLLQIFLIAFLPLLLKPNANAQSLLASNDKLNHYRHNPGLINEGENENDHPEIGSNEKTISTHIVLPINYYRPAYLVSNRVVENNFKVYPKFCPRFSRVYATCFKNNIRLAFKPFKMVIIPLWK